MSKKIYFAKCANGGWYVVAISAKAASAMLRSQGEKFSKIRVEKDLYQNMKGESGIILFEHK